MKILKNKAFLAIAACALFVAPALAKDRSGLMGDPARMRTIQANPSPALLDYQALMMPVQRAQQKAYYASICQLRSETYFRTFLNAAVEISQIEATKRNLSNDEILVADRNAKQIMQREDAEAGFDDLERRCQDLAGKLAGLDAMERSLAGNYH
jgi:hypothetical protein